MSIKQPTHTRAEATYTLMLLIAAVAAAVAVTFPTLEYFQGLRGPADTVREQSPGGSLPAETTTTAAPDASQVTTTTAAPTGN